MRISWANAAFMLFWVSSAGVATQIYRIGGDKATTLFYWLAALGITSSAFWGYITQKIYDRKQKAQEAAQNMLQGGGGAAAGASAAAQGSTGEGGDVDHLVKEAETKMAGSKIAPNAKLAELPVIFLLGDKGSTKTTVLMNSGMEPELLSGLVYTQDNTIVPTRGANFWFAKKAIFAEAAGSVWADGETWSRMLKKLAPGKLKSVFGGKGSAPRAAVLCVDLERFLQPGATEQMASVARIIQSRLQEFSTQFGISFPVYVLFTKTDRVPFFHDYVRNLSKEESTQVFGVTLPMRRTGGGVYAEEETQRLSGMFNELVYSLCDKRIEFLPRENDADKLPGCYEFPREFRKLRQNLVQFLVDVGRPSQLSTSAFLRGFYFTGVRPVFVNDIPSTPLFQQKSQSSFDAGGGATRMFNVKDVQMAGQNVAPMAAAQQQQGRKVPQWVFLTHLFNDILLEDKAAFGASEASTKTSFLQRMLLGLLAAASVVFTIGATVSFVKNRALENDVISATQQIKSVRLAQGADPSIDDLRRLELLRQKLFQLSDWKRNGAPWGYRWGLYVGDDMLPLVRKAYYDCFNQLLFSDTQSRMLTFLRTRPSRAKEDDDYNYAYATLRAHLMTTSEWKRSDGPNEDKWLGDTLLARWSENRPSIGDERKGLADLQFKFYGGDLRNGNPFSTREDADGVDKTRQYLASFSGFDRSYNALLAEAEKKSVAVNFNQKFPGSAAVVVNAKTVRGAFTRPGWKYMQELFKARGKNFGGEEWVLLSSKYKSAAAVPDNLDQLLRDRYTNDYIKIWREYFFNTSVFKPYGSARQAADKLSVHSGPGAPVLALIGLGSFHTNVEGTDAYADKVRKAFVWAATVVPPKGSETQFLADNNRAYTNGLSELQIAMNVAAGEQPAPTPMTAAMTQQKAVSALGQARSVAAFPGPDLEGKLDRKIMQIMEDPIAAADGVFNPANALNAAGKGFCDQFNPITRKFPFDPVSIPEVSVDELNALIKPGSGSFWQFYQNTLAQYMDENGNAKPGTGVRINPLYATFFQQVIRMSRTFYAGGAQSPSLNYSMTLTGVDLLIDNAKAKTGVITIDGKSAQIGGGPVAFRWTGVPTHSVRFAYNESGAFNQTGLWAIFRFFVDARVSSQGGAYLLEWPVRGGQGNREIATAKFLADLGGAPAVFDRRFFAGLRCVSTIALK